MNLSELCRRSAMRSAGAVAVVAPNGDLRYSELDVLANKVANALKELGVRQGDRVGLWLEKSVEAVAAMQAVLRLGAAYVPIDSFSPVSRVTTILADCAVAALITGSARLAHLPVSALVPSLLVDTGAIAERACLQLNWPEVLRQSANHSSPEIKPDDLAFILYTSGSTGVPKGVCIRHRNALAVVNWATAELRSVPEDVFSNHAPFHFDLSVLDFYVAFAVGASVCLVPESMSYKPTELVEFIEQNRITIWYSVPSALILMIEEGGLPKHALPSLRAVLFAGEPFSLKYLRRLYRHLPQARLLNFYGPTETNVCTFYEVTGRELEGAASIPIGKACSGDRVWARRPDGTTAQPGEEGELMVAGESVMLGYWGQPALGEAPYATGDWVQALPDGNYFYLGRRDHMVKVRGHRIELGEIETALESHPNVTAAATIVVGEGLAARLVAFVAGADHSRPSFLEMKKHSAARLPRYMIPDDFRFLPKLPYNRNGKIDRARLNVLAEAYRRPLPAGH